MNKVVSVGLGPFCLSWLAWGPTDGRGDRIPQQCSWGTTIEVRESTAGVDSSSRITQRRALQLVARIGQRPMRTLMDLGSIGSYIDAQECTARGIKIEAVDYAKELKMVDGVVVKMEGRI